MTLNYVTLTLDLKDGQGNIPVSGLAVFTPSAVLTDAGVEIVGQQPVTAVFHSAGVPAVSLLATDNAGPQPGGWTWSVSFSGITGAPAPFSFALAHADGASQVLSSLSPVSSGTAFQAYMPLPSGTPSAGEVPMATGSAEASAWAAGVPVPTGAGQYPVSNGSDQWTLTQGGTVGGNTYNAGWTVAASDLGGEALYNSASAGTATIPQNLTATVGASLAFRQAGAGILTVAAGSGVTVEGPAVTTAQYQALYARQVSANVWAVTASTDTLAGAAGLWGYLGWTADPLLHSNAIRPQGGSLVLVRFRAAATGTIGHIGYSLIAAGSGLTSSENWLGIYDTGQTLAGSATLTGSTAAQDSNFAGSAGPVSAAMASGTPAVTAGQDYFAAFLSNGTTRPQLASTIGSAAGTALANQGLSGLSLRIANGNTTYTTLPSAVTAANLSGTSTANLAALGFILTT